MNPTQFLAFNAQVAKLVTDTQAVMALRLMGMAGALPADADENDRMIAEKGPAFAKSASKMAAAAFAGKRPDEIMSAGMRPLQSEVTRNRKRLTK